MKNIGYSYNGFTSARLKRFLTTGGQQFTFIEYELNSYNEPTSVAKSTKTILGVLHKSSSSGSSILSSQSEQVGTTQRSSVHTAIMTSWESLVTGFSGGKELSPGMGIVINEVKYKIIKTENMNNWGIVAEITLEEYDEWKH